MTRFKVISYALSLVLVGIFASSPVLAQAWWDTSYGKRRAVTVTTAAVTPDKGYQDYTARIASFDTASLISASELQGGCEDLRLVYWDGSANAEIPRHLIDCNSATSDIRFAIQVAQAQSTSDAGYYLYYDNATAGAPPAVTPTNVYLWYDDASQDRFASYTQGRIDAWHGGGWQNSFAYNGAGYYTFNTGDNFTDGFRIPIDERDVYVEAEFFHTSCYPINMTTGMIARGIIGSGSGGSESSAHYYATSRAHNASCGGGYGNDGDIVKSFRTIVAANGANPGAVTTNAWRRQGLATWSINPTNLSFYDNNISTAWNALGFPNGGSLHVTGSDANDYEGRGFAGIITAQDGGRVRNIVIRRYIMDEPTVAIGPIEELPNPILLVTKTADIVSDAAVGEVITYTYVVTNSGNVGLSDVSLSEFHTGSGPAPDPDGESLTTDTSPTGDSTDASANDGVWDFLGPGDIVTLTGEYTVTQSDIDTLQ